MTTIYLVALGCIILWALVFMLISLISWIFRVAEEKIIGISYGLWIISGLIALIWNWEISAGIGLALAVILVISLFVCLVEMRMNRLV